MPGGLGASNVQTDFRGGEWSPAAQGRLDDKEYHRSLNVCLNSFPTEAGSWTRRAGTRWACFTRNGLYAYLATFAFEANAPYVIEFTDSALRFLSKSSTLVMDTTVTAITGVSTANPAVVTMASAPSGWATGDTVQFLFTVGTDVSGCGAILNRQFTITKLTSTTFSFQDSVTGVDIDGSLFIVPANNVYLGRVLIVASPYSQAQLPAVRTVQCEILSNNVLQGNVVTLHNSVAPQTIINSTPENTTAFAQFTMGAITFKDGPYFDPVNGTVSASATSGTITLSAAPASTFVSTDVGRMVRLFSEPPAWAVGTTYAAAAVVKYTDGNYYTSLVGSNVGQPCNTALASWALNPTAAQWQWGTIASYVSGTSVTVALNGTMPYSGTITTWRLGLYSATTGYPSCGCFHEGRLWLAGSQGNRFDASNSNDPFNFAPTALDGTVGDANSISYILNSNDVNPLLWMEPDHTGIICGTLGGEWVIQASALNDPLTPTSIQAHRVTKYKCANVPPTRAGLGLLFVKAQAKRLMEYVADVFSGRFLGRNLSEKAAHLTGSTITRIAYQQDLNPNIWVLMADGSLKGCLYKRESSFTTEPPTFTGWHRHTLGSGCTYASMASGPNADGTVDTIYFSALNPATGYYHIEYFADQFPESGVIAQAWHLDGAVPATSITTNGAHTQAIFYGFTPYIGRTITLWAGGLDLGDYTVASDGSITTTFGTPALWTYAFLTSWQSTATTAWDTSTLIKTTITPPALSIQSYVDTSVITSTYLFDSVYDPARSRLIEFGTSNTTADGFKVFDLKTGSTLATTTRDQLFLGTTLDVSSRFITGPATVDNDGNVYWYSSGGSNSGTLCKMSTAKNTLAFVASLGVYSGGFVTNQNHVMLPRQLLAFSVGGANLVLVSASVSNRGIALINGSTMQYAGYSGALTEKRSNWCVGFTANVAKTNTVTLYGLGSDTSISTAALGVYSLVATPIAATLSIPPGSSSVATNQGVTLTRTGGLLPSAIDATWTHISNVSGPVFDRTDGNIIIWASTTDAVTNTQYILKINPLTAAVVWATPTANIPNGSNGNISQSIVYSGSVAWMSGGHHNVCNTSTGVVTATTITGLIITGGQYSDDQQGGIVLYTQYSSGGGAPAPLNSTPASYTGWSALGGAYSPPAVSTQTYALPSIPAIAGYTFTSEGQKLRPAEPQEGGNERGPAFGKLRRSHWGMFQLALTQGISIGTQFADQTKVRTLQLSSDGRNTNALNVLFTGVARQPVDDDYSLDGMLAWQVTRPYPCFVAACGTALKAQDF